MKGSLFLETTVVRKWNQREFHPLARFTLRTAFFTIDQATSVAFPIARSCLLFIFSWEQHCLTGPTVHTKDNLLLIAFLLRSISCPSLSYVVLRRCCCFNFIFTLSDILIGIDFLCLLFKPFCRTLAAFYSCWRQLHLNDEDLLLE